MKSRNSKDWKVNREEKCCVDGWGRRSIDGNFERDTEGEWTYGKGKSVIDYLVGDWRIRKGVERIMIEEKVESNHSITAWIRGKAVVVGKKNHTR